MNFFELLFPDFSLILLGWLLCRFTALNRSVWDQVERLVYYVFFPVQLFQSILKAPLDLGALSNFISAGWALAASGIVAALLLPHLPWVGRRVDSKQHAACAQIAFRFNGFITLAMAERVAGAPGVALVAVLIGFCVPLFNVAAVWPMVRHSRSDFGKELLGNPLIIATVSGVLLNLTGVRIPELLQPSFTRLGNAALALGLMAAGAGLQLGALASVRTLAVSTLSIKHLLMPLAAFGLAQAMYLSPLQTTVLLLFAGTPTSPSSFVLAARMGYDAAPVAGLVTLSTVLGLLSLPMALALAR